MPNQRSPDQGEDPGAAGSNPPRLPEPPVAADADLTGEGAGFGGMLGTSALEALEAAGAPGAEGAHGGDAEVRRLDLPSREVERVFVAAAQSGRLVWLTESNGRYRIVQPYMVFRSSTGRRLLHLYQIGGYSSGGILREWKNPPVEAFDTAQTVDERWSPRADYNPFNLTIFPEVIFAVPTADGREREPNAR